MGYIQNYIEITGLDTKGVQTENIEQSNTGVWHPIETQEGGEDDREAQHNNGEEEHEEAYGNTQISEDGDMRMMT